MENLIVSLKFLGGLACLFALGHLIGHLLKLDQYYSDTPKIKNELKKAKKKHNHEIHA
jgi:hypothetical protein